MAMKLGILAIVDPLPIICRRVDPVRDALDPAMLLRVGDTPGMISGLFGSFDKMEFSFLKRNLVVRLGHLPKFSPSAKRTPLVRGITVR
jgi:hypothetical protein